MKTKLLNVLACRQCGNALTCMSTSTDSVGEVLTGSLNCVSGAHRFAIQEGIPRFVPRDNYAASFGYQWNKFKQEQIDSANGTKLSASRFYSETGWTKDWLKGKWVLDAGCGAGRFLDADSEAEVVGMDISSGIDAARANLTGRQNIHFVQASIYDPPFRAGAFDGCYCIGVVQHTPDPQLAMRTLPRFLQAGGRIAITAYERKPGTLLYGKYLVRPFTKRLDKQKLLSGIKGMMPVLFPITDLLFRLPLAGRRYDWAILDTFDMLLPQYDQPRTQYEIEQALSQVGIINLKRLNSAGLTVIGERSASGKLGTTPR